MLADRTTREGLLDMVFEAYGDLHIERVVERLVYELDENTLAAAQRGQFRSARRDPRSHDCAALAHSMFERSE